MNLKTLYATLAAFVIFFFLGWLVYGVLLMGFYENNMFNCEGLTKDPPNYILLIVANLIWSFFFVFILQRWAKITDFGKGFIAGLIIGFLVLLAFDLQSMAFMNLFNVQLFIVDLVVSTILAGIAGGVIGWILGAGMKKETT